MPKKSRTPPPPRRPVQAPKARAGRDGDADRRRRRLVLLVTAAAVAAVVAALLAVLAFGGGGGGSVAEKLRDADCTFATYMGLPNAPDHRDVPTLETRPDWNSFPPTTGPHYAQTAIWGIHDRPVPLVLTTHNLEHGGIVIHYGNRVPSSTVEQLVDFVRDDPNGIVLAPLPQLGNTIAMSAWFYDEARENQRGYEGDGKQAKCTSFDEGAFEAFRDAFRGKGPERAPISALQPGGN